MNGRKSLDRQTAERLLRAEVPRSVSPDLTRLLGAAAVGPRPEELSGEDAAAAAFLDGWRHATLDIPIPVRREPRFRQRAVVRLTVVIFATMVACGIGLAAAIGKLPMARSDGNTQHPTQRAVVHTPAADKSITPDPDRTTPAPTPTPSCTFPTWWLPNPQSRDQNQNADQDQTRHCTIPPSLWRRHRRGHADPLPTFPTQQPTNPRYGYRGQ
jgi:hypothetical protein